VRRCITVPELTRRHWLARTGLGFGAWALLDLLQRDEYARAADPLAARSPHFPAKARSVIFLMMAGGPSQMETFDPKPTLDKLSGLRMPESFGTIPAQFTDVTKQPLLGVKLKFRRCGESGLAISEAFPCFQEHADKLAVIRSCHHEAFNHSPAQYVLLTGQSRVGLPSIGAWIAYGLGNVAENLPALVVMTDPDGKVKGGTPLWGNGFLPTVYQGTTLQTKGTPVLYLDRQAGVTEETQRATLDFAQHLNRRHRDRTPAAADELDARIAAYELAFKMQSAAPDAVDVTRETAAAHRLYGLDDESTRDFGTRCLMARRLVERGVRFIQLISGSGDSKDWDHHDDSHAGTLRQARKVDRPIAGLLQDLAARGLLDSTLVVWSGEFGRTPTSQSKTGRDHNPNGFTMWMAGGGIRGGKTIGATDEIGLRAIEDKVHVHDAHATILGLLGLDHRKLTYLHQGRDQRLTDVGGENNLAERLTRD
jgi:uncharacterized protein (DUF1501 family)